jgi:hypothetical protein
MAIGVVAGKLQGKHCGESLPIECAIESAIKCLNEDGFEAEITRRWSCIGLVR